jgi:serine/threonine protein kinase
MKAKSSVYSIIPSLYCLLTQIQLEGFCQDARYLYFIMEFVPGGELLSYLRNVSRLEPYHAS